MSKSRVRRERTSSPLFERRGPTQAPPATPSLGLPGRPRRAHQAVRRPPAAPQPQAEPKPRDSRRRTRPPPGRWVTGTTPGTTPGPPPTARSEQVPGLLMDTHRQPPRPLPRPHARRQFPRGVRAGAASPPDPPSGARRARPGYGESRRRPLSSLLPQCVPPTETRLVFPGSGLSESWASEPRASGLPSGAVARQAQRWHCRGLPKVISRGFPHSNRRAGAHRKGGQLE